MKRKENSGIRYLKKGYVRRTSKIFVLLDVKFCLVLRDIYNFLKASYALDIVVSCLVYYLWKFNEPYNRVLDFIRCFRQGIFLIYFTVIFLFLLKFLYFNLILFLYF